MIVRSCFFAFTVTIALAAFAGCSRSPSNDAADPAQTTPTPSAETRAAQLEQLYADYWEAYLKLNPMTATFQGDPRYNAELPDFGSADYREQVRQFTADWLQQAQAIGAEGLTGADLLNYEIFVAGARKTLEAQKFPSWLMPVNQMGSIASFAVQLGSGTGAQPFKTVTDYDNWLARMQRLPVLFDTSIANMREGIESGVVQPRALMEKVIPQLDAIIKDKPEDTLFWGPITKMPADFPEADKQRLVEEYRSVIGEQLVPAYRELRDFIADEYLPAARATVGLDKLPGGVEWYAFNVRNATTTDLTPAQIHQIGLDEVERIHREIGKVMADVEFQGSMQEFFEFVKTDPRFTFDSEEALLIHYRALEARVNEKVPDLYSLIPKAPFEIRPVEPFRAESMAGGQYFPPSEDGSRPGIFYVNTFDLPTRKTWQAESLYLHEAIPGHHFQIALQIELEDMPAFRRWSGETAFAEGWGLYAESQGKALGIYTDPYNYFGYLQAELWRAIRLVTDTGLHSKGWSRQQVIDYMLENSAESEVQSIAEAERYIAWPGQALAYKIGELKIQELRERAETALGAGFDVREFHAEVLQDGAVPLGVLEAKIDRWIAAQRN